MKKRKKITKHWKQLGMIFVFAGILLLAPAITTYAYDTSSGDPNDVSATAVLSGNCGDHAEYTLYSNGNLYITGSGDMFDFLQKKDKNKSAYSATPWGKYLRTLYNNSKVNHSYTYPAAIHVYIDADITLVGANSFCYINKLRSVMFESGTQCKSIEKYAFWGCSGLTSFEIPPKVCRINEGVFGKTGLTAFDIPSQVYHIGYKAFYGSKLRTITIPASVHYMDGSTFESCTSLRSVDMSKCKETVLNKDFANCTALKSVLLPNSLLSIRADSFNNCRSLTSITIPSNVRMILKSAFYNTKSLKTMTIESKKLTDVYPNAIKNSNRNLVIKVPASKYNAYKKLFTTTTGFLPTMKIKKIS